MFLTRIQPRLCSRSRTTEDDEEYEGWVVEYYPAESPFDPVPSGARMEWSPVGCIKGNGPCGKFVKWISEQFLIAVHIKKERRRYSNHVIAPLLT